MADQGFNALEHLKKNQKKLIPGEHDKPFLEDPASFQSVKDPGELVRSQTAQYVKIPDPVRDPPVMDLAEVIGSAAAAEIVQGGQFVFHAVGDTGNPKHSELGEVVPAMARDFYRPNPADRPAIFLHLGDVCYNMYEHSGGVIPAPKAGMYQTQFYTPYAGYPGKIIAIPGNHDSNPEEDPQSINTFQDNFCAPLPDNAADLDKIIASKTRQPMFQPAVYYRLDALPYAQVIALFSNGGENAGVLRDQEGVSVGNGQWDFLVGQLKKVRADRDATPPVRRALIVAVHHPPFSGGGGHSGSSQMLGDLDAAFAGAGILPDLVLSGHAHNYQRFTRTVNDRDGKPVEIPFVVAGNGGHAITSLKPNQDGTPVQTPLRGAPSASGGSGGQSLRQYFNGYGHLLVTVTRSILTVDLIGTHTNSSAPVDSVTVDLNTRKITHETPPLSHPALGEEEKHRAE
jgi:hypothetical protein